MDSIIVDSLLKVGKLKSLKRTGWVREGMPDPESVAEHTFRVCFLILVLGDDILLLKEGWRMLEIMM
jgi:putative hydrolase of HD superfamily